MHTALELISKVRGTWGNGRRAGGQKDFVLSGSSGIVPHCFGDRDMAGAFAQ